MKRIFVAVTVVVIAVLSGGFASAAWLSSAGSGSAKATGASVGAGNAPTANASGSSVTVSWNASTLATGYVVKRYNALDVAQSVGNNCSGTITLLTCTETGVAVGSWKYSVTPLNAGWTGTESGKTNVTVAAPVVDTTAPTATITFPVNGASYSATAYNAGCSPNTSNVCGSASDATGVASVKASIRQASSGKYWNTATAAFDLPAETFFLTTLDSANATSTSWRLPVTLPATATSYTIHVQTADTLGNLQTGATYAATSTFTITPTLTASLTVNSGHTVTASGTSNLLNGATFTVALCKTSNFPCAAGDTPATASLTATVNNTNGNWTTPASANVGNGTVIYAKATYIDGANNTATATAGPVTA